MLALTLAELDSFRSCDEYQEVRARLSAASVDPCHAFTAAEAQTAGCNLFDVLWAAARVAQKDSEVRARLTGFVLDLVAMSVPLVEAVGGTTDGLRSLVETERTAGAILQIERSETAKEAQQELAELFAPWMIVADAFWATEEAGHWRSLHASIDRAWAEWAQWTSWMIEAARALHIEAAIAGVQAVGERQDEFVQQGRAVTDAGFLDRLVQWLGVIAPRAIPTSAAATRRKQEFNPAASAWDDGSLEWHHVAVLWNGIRSFEGVSVGRNGKLVIPASVRRIGSLVFYEGGEILVEDGCRLIENIDISHGGTLILPKSVIAVNSIRIHAGGSIEGHSPRYIAELEVHYHGGIAPGTRFLGSVNAWESNLELPSTICEIGELFISNPQEENPLLLPEALSYLGAACLEGPLELVLPENLKAIGPICLRNDCELFVPRSISTMVEIDRGPDCRVTLTGEDGPTN